MIRQIWILIAKKISGDATDEELKEFDQHSDRNEVEHPVSALEQIWNSTSTFHPGDNKKLDERWERFEKIWKQDSVTDETRLLTEKGIFHHAWAFGFFRYAALVLLVLISGYLLWPSDRGGVETTMVAPVNGVSKMVLPDGSSVWLNSGSKITYKNNNGTNCREVSLVGEAYFEVAEDRSHPFIVTTTTFKVKVLGTAFNVKSYNRSGKAEATLVRGKIELSLLGRPGTKYILRPSQKLTVTSAFADAEKPSRKEENKDINDEFLAVKLAKVHDARSNGVPVEILWFKSHFDFDNATFGEIASMMEHKYNVRLIFRDPHLSEVKFSGKFRDETLEDALKELKEILDFNYKIKDGEVVIY